MQSEAATSPTFSFQLYLDSPTLHLPASHVPSAPHTCNLVHAKLCWFYVRKSELVSQTAGLSNFLSLCLCRGGAGSRTVFWPVRAVGGRLLSALAWTPTRLQQQQVTRTLKARAGLPQLLQLRLSSLLLQAPLQCPCLHRVQPLQASKGVQSQLPVVPPPRAPAETQGLGVCA